MIRKLVAQYFQLVDPSDLALLDGPVIVRPDVQIALYECMFAESVFPLPPTNYRSRVLKLILARIEASIRDPEEDEILDDLMSSWTTLVATPKTPALEQAQQLELVKYTAPVQPDTTDSMPERTVITSESRGLIYGSGTTGFRTWEAALHLGSFLATGMGESFIRGKRVIELGAGTGFLSLLCARHLGAQAVVATDRETALIENMDRCASHNQTGIAVALPFYPVIWEWGTPLDVKGAGDAVSERTKFDVALGADLVYDADLVPLLLSTVQDLFDHYGLQQFIISATVRNEDTFGTFLSVCESHAFTVEQLPFESVQSEFQTGFFHSTSTPIRTYRILPSS